MAAGDEGDSGAATEAAEVKEEVGSSKAPAPKPRWADEPEVDVDEPEVDLSSLAISNPQEGTIDLPDTSIKTFNDAVEDAKIEKEILDNNSLYSSAARFEDLQISETLLRGIYSEMKFDRPSKIQAEALPLILKPPYSNLIAQAHNGSGKTTCFVLGMLSRVEPSLKEPQAVCICPTRELALQNLAVLLKMAKYSGITSVCAVPQDKPDSRSSTRRARLTDQVVIGTPGTIKRWITVDKILRLDSVKIIVFDEADHMLDTAGFQDDSMKIMREVNRATHNTTQILLFSATFSEKVKQFVSRQIPIANKVLVEKEKLSLDVIKQYRVKCPNKNAKFLVLKDRIYPIAEKLGQSIIFARTRESVTELHRNLEADGHRCTSIQGGQRPEERDRVIDDFRKGKTRILISTDVLARGFDVAQVTLVVNFDLPEVPNQRYRQPDFETYLHRIGRSGRFGRKGAAFNLVVDAEDERILNKIEDHFQRKIPAVPWEDDDAFEVVLQEAGLR